MTTKIVVVGGGIGGVGIGYFLCESGKDVHVTVLEQEDQLAYHTTGRSAAFYAETYGGPVVQPLTTASKAFLRAPDRRFFDHPVLAARGAVHIFTDDQKDRATALFAAMQPALPSVQLLDQVALHAKIPYLADDFVGGIDDPDCGELDVAVLHQGYVRGIKAAGGVIDRSRRMVSAQKTTDGWTVQTTAGTLSADILVNAAGAWADHVAGASGVQPLNIQCYRRTLLTTGPVAGIDAHQHRHVVLDADEAFYFKPEGDGFLISPADQTPDVPRDAYADDLDVAVAVDAFERATGRQVSRVTATWAGLRSFAPDRQPVIGFDSEMSGFFWCAGQGGWGIQTSPAWSALAAHMITGVASAAVDVSAIDPAPYAPSRFSTADYSLPE